MKESIHKYFKLGTLQWMSFPNSAPLDALTAIARDDFFDAVEIKSYGTEKEQAKAILDQSHLTVAFGAHPMQLKDKLNPNALDESERQKAEDALKGAIDEAAYLGATAMAFLAGHWEEATKEQAYAQLVKTTNALCDYAAEKGLGVELEVFDYDVDKAALIGPAPLAARFAADVCSRHKNFGLIVDLIPLQTLYLQDIKRMPRLGHTEKFILIPQFGLTIHDAGIILTHLPVKAVRQLMNPHQFPLGIKLFLIYRAAGQDMTSIIFHIILILKLRQRRYQHHVRFRTVQKALYRFPLKNQVRLQQQEIVLPNHPTGVIQRVHAVRFRITGTVTTFDLRIRRLQGFIRFFAVARPKDNTSDAAI